MVPSSVAKIKLGTRPVATSNTPRPFQTWPVGRPVEPARAFDGGTVTTSALGTPLMLKRVLVPADVLENQNGLAGDVDIPQVPTRFGSVLSATPATSANRFFCVKLVAACAAIEIVRVAKT